MRISITILSDYADSVLCWKDKVEINSTLPWGKTFSEVWYCPIIIYLYLCLTTFLRSDVEEIFDSGSRFNRRRKPRGAPSTCSRSNLSFSDLINLTRANIHWERVSGNMVEWNSTVASRVGTWSNLRKQMKEWRDWMWMEDGLWMLVTPGCTGYTRWVLADSNEVTLVTLVTVVTGVIHGLHWLHGLL